MSNAMPDTAPRRRSLIERAAEREALANRIARPVDEEAPVEEAVHPVESVVVEGKFAPIAATDDAFVPEQPPVIVRTRGARHVEIDREPLIEAGFIMPGMVPSALAEEFRIVKRQLLQFVTDPEGDGDPRRRAILVCSAQPNEGKTFCSTNLALSMAREKDIEVLLVDADFAKPEILSTLGIEGGPGLMDMIADPSLDLSRCVITTDIDNLAVLPAGGASNDATELLASERTRTVFEHLLANPDRVVIFDSSPALAASTGSVLAQLVGQVLMVVRADVTGESELREALALVDRCPTVQLLLNAVELPPQARRFGGYYGYGG